MEKLDNILTDYSPWIYSALPKFLRRRVNALKKIQLERIKVELEYHKELQELELKYAKLFEPFNERRAQIVSGAHEPTDEECQLPPQISDDDPFEGDQENAIDKPELKLTDAEEKELAEKVKGIPSFWLNVLRCSSSYQDSIEDDDRPIMKYLNDIRVKYDKLTEDTVVHTIEFQFDENPYFTNKTLTKRYHLKLEPDEKDPFSFDGHELVKIEGCPIDWIPGKDPTVKSVMVKQKNKHDGSIRSKAKTEEKDSFFHFFSPPAYPTDKDDSDPEDHESALASLDFELAELMRQNLVPKAVLYFSGDIADDDDDDGDDEDNFEDEEDSYEDTDESDGSENESDSEDSLAKIKKSPGKKVGMKLHNSNSKNSPKGASAGKKDK